MPSSSRPFRPGPTLLAALAWVAFASPAAAAEAADSALNALAAAPTVAAAAAGAAPSALAAASPKPAATPMPATPNAKAATPKPAPAKPASGKPSPAPSPAEDLYGPPVTPEAVPREAPPKPPVSTEPKVVIREIVVRGNRRISDDRILLSIPLTVGDKAGRGDIVDAIQRIYGMGYFQDVKEYSEPVLGGERIIFNVVENPVLGDVAFTGVTKVEPAKLEELFQSMKGDTINYNAIKEAVEKIQKIYVDAGYPLARVADMGMSPGGVLQLRIAEGKINQIKITGNEETKDFVILRELTTKPGEIFSSEKMKNDLRRVYNLNYFENLNLKFEPAPNDEVTVVIDVKEKQTGSVNVGAGYSTQQGILGMLSIKKDNLFGTGQQIGVDFSISQYYAVTGELTYFNPWIDENRTSLGASLYARRFNNFLADFREERQGTSLTIGRPLLGDSLTSPWRASVGVKAERISTYENLFVGGNLKPAYPLGTPLAGVPITLNPSGTDTYTGGTLGVTYDTRDIIMNPTEGGFHSFSLEPGLLNGSSPLVRGIGAVNQFFPMPALPWAPTERTTIAVGLRLGLTGGAFVPAYERFFSTGAYLIRGWPEFVSLNTPIAQQYPINYFQGSNAFVGSLEYRFPIFNVVSGVVFGDTGILWDQATFNPNLLHSGYGAGLRLNTPLGPIRLDYGISGQANVPGQFHFSIGQKF